jgi:hypothetical protein
VLLAAVAGWEFSSAEVCVVSVSSGPAAAPPLTQQREFWVLIGYAVAPGVFGAVAGLVSIGVIKSGGKWYIKYLLATRKQAHAVAAKPAAPA